MNRKDLRTKRTYYNPLFGFLSAKTLYEKMKFYGLAMQEINEFVKQQETFQLHKTIKKTKSIFFQ